MEGEDDDFSSSEGGYEVSEGGYGSFSLGPNPLRPISMQFSPRGMRARGHRGHPPRGAPRGRVRGVPPRGRAIKSQSMDFVVGGRGHMPRGRGPGPGMAGNRMSLSNGEFRRHGGLDGSPEFNLPPTVPEGDGERFDEDGFVIPPPPPSESEDSSGENYFMPPPPPPDDGLEFDENGHLIPPPPPPDDGLEFDEDGHLIIDSLPDVVSDEAESESPPPPPPEEENETYDDDIHSESAHEQGSVSHEQELAEESEDIFSMSPITQPRFPQGQPLTSSPRGQPRGRPRGRPVLRGGPRGGGGAIRGAPPNRGVSAPRGVAPRGGPQRGVVRGRPRARAHGLGGRYPARPG